VEANGGLVPPTKNSASPAPVGRKRTFLLKQKPQQKEEKNYK